MNRREKAKELIWIFLENFDEENAYISTAGISKYVKDGYYDLDNNKWIKYIDGNPNVWLKNIGKENENVKLVAQWEEVYSYNIEFDKNEFTLR